MPDHLRTRVARQVTFGAALPVGTGIACHRQRAGVPDSIRDRLFYPAGLGARGFRLGLTLAQTFVQQHHGLIEVESPSGPDGFQDSDSLEG